jgi:hypothetical protein
MARDLRFTVFYILVAICGGFFIFAYPPGMVRVAGFIAVLAGCVGLYDLYTHK